MQLLTLCYVEHLLTLHVIPSHPQIAEVKVLKQYITQGAHKLQLVKPPQAVTNIVSWRTEGIKHKKVRSAVRGEGEIAPQDLVPGRSFFCDTSHHFSSAERGFSRRD